MNGYYVLVSALCVAVFLGVVFWAYRKSSKAKEEEARDKKAWDEEVAPLIVTRKPIVVPKAWVDDSHKTYKPVTSTKSVEVRTPRVFGETSVNKMAERQALQNLFVDVDSLRELAPVTVNSTHRSSFDDSCDRYISYSSSPSYSSCSSDSSSSSSDSGSSSSCSSSCD